jgi:hypothetical protein
MSEHRNVSGPCLAAFSFSIADMPGFKDVRKIVKICPPASRFFIEPMFRYRTPKSDRLPDIRNPYASRENYLNRMN